MGKVCFQRGYSVWFIEMDHFVVLFVGLADYSCYCLQCPGLISVAVAISSPFPTEAPASVTQTVTTAALLGTGVGSPRNTATAMAALTTPQTVSDIFSLLPPNHIPPGWKPAPRLMQVQIYPDTSSFDRIDRDTRNTLETQLAVIGGTMGLLTGGINRNLKSNEENGTYVNNFKNKCLRLNLTNTIYIFQVSPS